MKPKRTIDKLFQPEIHECELAHRLRLARQQHSIAKNTAEGLDLDRLHRQRRPFCRRLARDLRVGAWQLSPAWRVEAVIGGKRRILYHSSLIDSLITGAVGRILTELVTPSLSKRVFSYRKGQSQQQVLREAARFVQHHRQQTPDVKKRGLYVLKRDISAYGESIPTAPGSRLWSLLEEAFAPAGGVPTDHPFARLLTSLVRRDIQEDNGVIAPLPCGIPTGSSIQPPLCNLYLTDLDRHLEKIPGAFYARFGDDFIFMHPDMEITRAASRDIDRIVDSLALSMRATKQQNFFFNGAGRSSPDAADFHPSSFVAHLGSRLSFKGEISLKKEKQRRLLSDLKARIRSSASLLRDATLEERAGAICHAVNRALSCEDTLAYPGSDLLLHHANDRDALARLDYAIALEISRAVTGCHRVAAFRTLSWSILRNQFGLISLVHRRNLSGRRTRETFCP